MNDFRTDLEIIRDKIRSINQSLVTGGDSRIVAIQDELFRAEVAIESAIHETQEV